MLLPWWRPNPPICWLWSRFCFHLVYQGLWHHHESRPIVKSFSHQIFLQKICLEARGLLKDPILISKSINQTIKQSTNQPINQSTNQPINQSTNQPINQPINQSINISIKRWNSNGNLSKANLAPKLNDFKQTIEQQLSSSGLKPVKVPASSVTPLKLGYSSSFFFFSFSFFLSFFLSFFSFCLVLCPIILSRFVLFCLVFFFFSNFLMIPAFLIHSKPPPLHNNGYPWRGNYRYR